MIATQYRAKHKVLATCGLRYNVKTKLLQQVAYKTIIDGFPEIHTLLALLIGMDLNLYTLIGLKCWTSSDPSESMVFLRKSIHSRFPKGGGSKPQNIPLPRMPDLT